MSQYLLMGKYFFSDATGAKGGLDKNLAGMLSRTNLSAIFANLPDEERTFVSRKYNTLKATIKQKTVRDGGSTIFTDPSQQYKYTHIKTTVDQFIHNVFKENDDNVTSKFGGFHKMGLESIDPENKRTGSEKGKLAPIFELRNIIPTDNEERFGKEKWKGLATFQMNILSVLNKLSDAAARKKINIKDTSFGMESSLGDDW